MSIEVGSKVQGKVTGITNFGAFVELPDGKTGLVHISEVADNYVKDINNTLNKYIGTWKGSHNGKVYEMKFNKSLYDDMGMKKDEITGRLRITTNGNLSISIFDNFNEQDDAKTSFSGLGLTTDLQGYRMIFAGPVPSGCINHGTISLRINPSTPNQMKVKYWSYNDIVVGDCPSTFSQTFPEQQEIFLTRQ